MEVLFKYNIRSADSIVASKGHLIGWETKELDLRFIAISTKKGFNIQLNEELQDKLKSLGVSSLTLKIRDEVIKKLLDEYLRFLFFPLCIDLIEKENKNK